MRVLLFAGGEGTASVAMAAARQAAGCGHRVLLLTDTPPADAVSSDRLSMRPLDAAGWAASSWPDALAGWVRGAELPVAWGLDRLAWWARLEEVRHDPAPDALVVDCGSPAQLAAILAAAEAVPWLLSRSAPGPWRGTADAAAVLAAGERLGQRHAELRDGAGSIHLVATVRPGLPARLRESAAALGFHGFPPAEIVLDQLPDPRAVPASVAADFPGLPVRAVPAGIEPESDPAVVYGDDDPVAVDPAVAEAVVSGPAGSGGRTEFTWTLPLPFTERSRLDLARSGDELILTRAGDRRVLALPPVLRRCLVTGAGLHDGALRIRFRPDPKVWPDG